MPEYPKHYLIKLIIKMENEKTYSLIINDTGKDFDPYIKIIKRIDANEHNQGRSAPDQINNLMECNDRQEGCSNVKITFDTNHKNGHELWFGHKNRNDGDDPLENPHCLSEHRVRLLFYLIPVNLSYANIAEIFGTKTGNIEWLFKQCCKDYGMDMSLRPIQRLVQMVNLYKEDFKHYEDPLLIDVLKKKYPFMEGKKFKN